MDWATAIGFEDTHHTAQHVIFVRLIVAAALGAAIGYERGATHGTAGLRTHVLIAVAAALFTSLAFEIYDQALAGGSQTADPIRAIEATTAGVAFLGAGAIFRQRGSVQGLTTGAGMWLAGAVGVASALGYYLIAGGVALLAILVLVALRAFSHEVVSAENVAVQDGTGRPGER